MVSSVVAIATGITVAAASHYAGVALTGVAGFRMPLLVHVIPSNVFALGGAGFDDPGKEFRQTPNQCISAICFKEIGLGKGVVIDGENVPTPEDIAKASAFNQDWDRFRRGDPLPEVQSGYPRGNNGDGYERAMGLRASERKAKGEVWTTEQISRDDWPRAWKHIGPLIGDCDPKTVTPELLSICGPRSPRACREAKRIGSSRCGGHCGARWPQWVCA
jgi:hypothetical protein